MKELKMENTLEWGLVKAIDFRMFIGCPCHVEKMACLIEGVDVNTNTVIVSPDSKLSLVKIDPKDIKPILRRFETLSRSEVEQLNKLWPKENIQRTTFGSIKLDAHIIDYLTQLHVDVFGWIDQGLAIDAGA